MSYSLNAPRKFPLEDFWKVKIVPPSAGVDALVVRDYADTVSRIKIMEGDKGIWGYDAAGTWMFRLMPYDAYDAITFNTGVDFRDKMLLSGPYFTLANGKSIRTEGTATSSFLLRSHDGAAYVDCAKLVGGFLEIAKGKLTGDLIPDTDQARNLGSETLGFFKVWFTEWWSPTDVVFIREHLRTKAIKPTSDGIFDLGYDDSRWRSIFFGTSLIADSDPADDVTTLVDSPPVTLRGSYWDSVNLVAVDIDGAIKLHVDGEGSAHIEFDRKLEFPGGTLTGGLAPDTDLNRVLGSGTAHFYEIYTRAVRRTGGFLELRSSHGVYCYLASNYAFAPGADNSNDLGSGSYRWRKLVLGTECRLLCNPATSSVTTQDSPVLRLRGAYWDGATSVAREGEVFHRMLSTTPTSELAFRIAGADYFRIGDDGVITHKDILPDVSNTRSLGSATKKWALSYFYQLDASQLWCSYFRSGIFRPYTDCAHDLGETTRRWRNIIFALNLIARSDEATSTETLKGSPSALFKGAYWDGTASVDRDAKIFHRMLSTTPTSEIVFQIAGTDYMAIGDDRIKVSQSIMPTVNNAYSLGALIGATKYYFAKLYLYGPIISGGAGYDLPVQALLRPYSNDVFDLGKSNYRFKNLYLSRDVIIPASYNILGRSYAGTAITVTETTWTLKDECAPVSPKNVLYPLNIVVDASNPTGSLVTLYVEVRLLHSDGTETTVESFNVAEGTTASKDYATEFIAKALKEGVSITAVRLYAYCDVAPATGYEPSVTLTKVCAFQF